MYSTGEGVCGVGQRCYAYPNEAAELAGLSEGFRDQEYTVTLAENGSYYLSGSSAFSEAFRVEVPEEGETVETYSICNSGPGRSCQTLRATLFNPEQTALFREQLALVVRPERVSGGCAVVPNVGGINNEAYSAMIDVGPFVRAAWSWIRSALETYSNAENSAYRNNWARMWNDTAAVR
ncbi:MAG: hypothetical protein ABH859_08320 [Pseudomonadota bacterium]